MLTLINHQKRKDVGEILYEHNTESNDQTVDWKNMSKLSFKKKEAFLRKVIFVFGMVWVLFLIGLTVFSWFSNNDDLEIIFYI